MEVITFFVSTTVRSRAETFLFRPKARVDIQVFKVDSVVWIVTFVITVLSVSLFRAGWLTVHQFRNEGLERNHSHTPCIASYL